MQQPIAQCGDQGRIVGECARPLGEGQAPEFIDDERLRDEHGAVVMIDQADRRTNVSRCQTLLTTFQT